MSLGDLGRAQKWLLVFGLVVAVLLGAIFWAVRVNRRHISQLNLKLKDAEKVYKDTRELADSRDGKRARLDELAGKLSYLQSLRWEEPDYMPQMIRALSALAERDGLRLKAVKPMVGGAPAPEAASAGPVLSTRKITIVVSGGYGEVYRFINDLQYFPVLVSVLDVRVGIGSGERPGGLPILDAVLNTEISVLPKVEVESLAAQPEEAAAGVGGLAGGAGVGGVGLPHTSVPQAGAPSEAGAL